MQHEVPRASVPGSHSAAAASLVDYPVVGSYAFKERFLRENAQAAHPLIEAFALAFLKDVNARGWPLFAHEYVRDKKRQNELKAKGASKAAWGRSPHNFGCAVDVIHFGKWWNLTEKQWSVIGLVGKEVARKKGIRMKWGGDWSFYDPAHWELEDWRDRKTEEYPVRLLQRKEYLRAHL